MPSEHLVARSAIDYLKNSIRDGMREDAFGPFSPALVVSPMKDLSGAESVGLGGTNFTTTRVAAYKFHVRLIGEGATQHACLTDPCELAFAGDFKGANSVANLHTEILVYEETQAGMVVTINVGDIVLVRLDKRNIFGFPTYNLQTGEFVSIYSRTNSPTNLLSATSCQALVDSFPYLDALSYPSSGNYPRGVPLMATYIGPNGGPVDVVNGQIPDSLLGYVDTTYSTGVKRQERLLIDVIENFNNLAKAYYDAGFGKLAVNSGYRPYETQVRLKNELPRLAARPGTSNHGWGLAFDWQSGGFDTDRYKWMLANAPQRNFNFTNPSNLRRGGSGPDESWHFETTKRNEYVSNLRQSTVALTT